MRRLAALAAGPVLAQGRVDFAGSALCEMVVAVRQVARIVGRGTRCTHPAELAAFPNVGKLRALSAEGLLSRGADPRRCRRRPAGNHDAGSGQRGAVGASSGHAPVRVLTSGAECHHRVRALSPTDRRGADHRSARGAREDGPRGRPRADGRGESGASGTGADAAEFPGGSHGWTAGSCPALARACPCPPWPVWPR